jgi:hypothetical protein
MHEAMMHEQEEFLSILQHEEADCQLKVIAERASILAAAAVPELL